MYSLFYAVPMYTYLGMNCTQALLNDSEEKCLSVIKKSV